MFLHRDDLEEQFAKLFVISPDGYFFRRPRVGLLLRITEAEYYEAMDAFRIRSKLAMLATWVVGLGAAIHWFVDFVQDKASPQTYFVILGAFAFVALIHAHASLSVARPFDVRLRAAQAEAKAKDPAAL